MHSAKRLEKAVWLNCEILSSSIRGAVTGTNTAGSWARIGRECTAAVVEIELVGLSWQRDVTALPSRPETGREPCRTFPLHRLSDRHAITLW